MDVAIRIPTCNIIACEDIAISGDQKMYICNPFTGTSGRCIKKFYTYTVIQGIPNGRQTFKIQITDSNDKTIKQTDDTTVEVEENLIRAKTQWSNIIFSHAGEYMIKVLIKCNNCFDMIGCSHINIK